MNKTLAGLTIAAVVFTVGGALAQQAGGGPQPQLGTKTPNTQDTATPQTVPQPGSPGTQSGKQPQTTGAGGQGNNATSTEKK